MSLSLTFKQRKQLFEEAEALLNSCNSRDDGLPVNTELSALMLDRERLREMVVARLDLRSRIKRLRNRKQRIAAQFKTVTEKGHLDSLKEAMSGVCAVLAETEEELRRVEDGLIEALTSRENTTATSAVRQLPRHLNSIERHEALPKVLQFEALTARNRGDWDDFIGSQPGATLYHDSRWLDVIEGVMGQRSLSLLARDGSGAVVGVLPLYRQSSPWFGDFAVSIPYMNYGGALATCGLVEDALMADAAERVKLLGVRHIEFRDRIPRQEWSRREDKVSMVRFLPASQEELDEELGAKLRSQIRRAERENIVIEYGCGEPQLNAFYSVFSRNMRDLGTPVYGRDLFSAVLDTWRENSILLVLKLDGIPVGGAFLIQYRDTMEIPWASTIRKFNRYGINMLMYREAIRLAIERGCRFFDFGRSTADSGTYRFKKQWGAQPVQHYWHYWLSDGAEMPSLTPDSPRYRLLVRLWQRLPLTFTRWLGPMIARSLP